MRREGKSDVLDHLRSMSYGLLIDGKREPDDPAYRRQPFNPIEISFPEATCHWGTVTHFVVFIDGKIVLIQDLRGNKVIMKHDLPKVTFMGS